MKRSFAVPHSVVLGLFSVEVLLYLGDVFPLFIIFILISVPFIGAAFVYQAYRKIKLSQYLECGSWLVAVLLLIIFVGFPWVREGYSYYAASRIKLNKNKTEYLQEINNVKPGSDGYRFKEFDWGGYMMNPRKLIYDESDGLGAPQSKSTPAWRKKIENSELASCRYHALNIAPHFYVVDFSC